MASRVSRRVYAPTQETWLVDEDTAERGKDISTFQVQGQRNLKENARLDVPEDILLQKLLKAGLREEFKPFCNQVDGLKWMLGQEKRASVPLKGGILAGEC